MDEKEARNNIDDTERETENTSVEDPFNMHRAASNETTLISEIPNIIWEKNVFIRLGQRKIPVSTLNDKFCEERVFPYLLSKGKFGYSPPRDFPVIPGW